jgi:hypothetical protein
MHAHLFEIIEFVAGVLLAGVLMILDLRKKMGWRFWVGVGLLVFEITRGGMAWNQLQEARRQEAVQEVRKKEQKGVMKEMFSKRILPQDSLAHFDGTVEILVPAGFAVSNFHKPDIESILMTKAFEGGAYIVSVSKLNNKENLSFKAYAQQLDEMHRRSIVHYEITPNATFTLPGTDCRALDYKAFQKNQLASAGVMFNASKGKYLYSIVFSNNGVDPARTKEFTEKIFKSIRITE